MQLNPNDPLIQKNLPKVKRLLADDSLDVFIIATPELKELIAKDEHPLVKGMPDSYKGVLLEGKGLMIQKRLVWDWLNNVLDEKNSFVLSKCDVRAFQDGGVNITNILKEN